MTARPITEGERAHRNVTTEAMLRHIRVVTKDNSVQLWFGDTHITNVEPDSISAIALQAFAADQPHALLSTSSEVRRLREALETIIEDGLWDAANPNALKSIQGIARTALSVEGEDELARATPSAPISTDTKDTTK